MKPPSISSVLANYEIADRGNRYQGRCPIHRGDNPSAFCLYKETGVWQCFTHNCHLTYGNNIRGLYRALKLDYSSEAAAQQYRPVKQDLRVPCVPNHPRLARRDDIRRLLSDIPSEYFIRRGFCKNILDRYDVGTCLRWGKPMYKRAVVPIYDMNQEYAIGYTGRDITGKSPNKWLHSKGFKKAEWLYNVWNAKEEISRTKTAILVEGPGDIWRLEEAGIHCGLAIMGTSVSYHQKILLSNLGILNILVLTDLNDKAGKKAASDIYESLKGLYNICIPQLDFQDDIGGTSVRWIIDNIEPILRKCFE